MAGVSGGGIGVLPSSVRYRSCTYAEEDDFRGLFHFSVSTLYFLLFLLFLSHIYSDDVQVGSFSRAHCDLQL